CDLQSGFLRIGDERPPIRVDGGATEIREMILMPETTSQDGNIGALNTTLAHEFGHQLGLPDLYSTFSFAPGVGVFDLMDLESGTVDVGEISQQIVSGALPTGLSAWSRIFLGWLTPQEITADSVVASLLASWHPSSGTRVLKIPIAPGEYFLLENRQTDLDGDGTAFLNFKDGIIVGPSNANRQPTREYDYLLPGSGILIWHVDENVALGDFNRNGESNWAENAVQWDEFHRFLDLEEADGIQEIGFTSAPPKRQDMFFVGNNAFFGPATSPDSRHYSGADSHVNVRITTNSRLFMGVTVTRSHTLSGWPVAVGGPAGTHASVAADADGDGVPEIFTASSDGRLYGYRGNGTRFIANTDTIRTLTFSGDTLSVPVGVFASVPGVFLSAPAMGDLEDDGMTEVVAVDAEQVYAWHSVDENTNGRADLKPGFPVRLIEPSGTGTSDRIVLTPPVLFRIAGDTYGIAVGTTAGGLIVLRADGSLSLSINTTEHLNERMPVSPAAVDLNGDGADEFVIVLFSGGIGRVLAVDTVGRTLWSQTVEPMDRAFAPTAADLDGDGAFDIVVVGTNGQVNVFSSDGKPLAGWPVRLPSVLSAPPAVGDIDGDGLPEVVLSGDNRIFALHGSGVPVTNFPVVIDRVVSVGAIASSPALGDMDGDRIADIVVGLPNQTVAAFQGNGQPVSGFPFGVSGAVSSAPALWDLNGRVALAVGADDGFVHLRVFSGDPDVLPWPMTAHDPRRSGASQTVAQKPPPRSGRLFADASVFCYPNPAGTGSTGIRYTLNRPADTVRIRIFSLAGDLIDEMSGAAAQQENEVRWNTHRAASGVYLCQVEAQDAGDSQTVFFKIAVVK
ncbi:MAG: VCBS repeat-containing protein, partial [candidate division Zixibacteria bacterium]|nr:VCBS repeat-containing protein [candidate division Zixibacteria bacterium]